jgi:hypothetical protein
MAAEPTSRDLNQMLPEPEALQQYLTAVRSLLVNLSDKIATKSKLADRYKPVYRQIVFTAAWQESCWRQYIKEGTPLTSETGDLGLMQVNRHTWRGVYDLKGLGGDIEYNGTAGGEILYYYLTRHAIKKGEDRGGQAAGRQSGAGNLLRLQRRTRRAGAISASGAKSEMEKGRRSVLGQIPDSELRERTGSEELLPEMSRRP